MNFSFENQGTYTYLVYSIGSGDSLDTMSLGMLTNNKITGIAPTLYTQMDEEKYIKYNVSAKISVKQFFTGPVNRKRLLGVFSGIVNGLISAEDYMIDANSIILDLDYIFVDVSTCNTVLICLPIAGAVENDSDLGMFFKNIMFNIQSDQTENCNHVAEIINYLNSSPVFSLVDFKKVLDSLQNESGLAVHSSEPAPTRPETPPTPPKVVDRPPQNVPQAPPQQPKPVNPAPVAPPVQNTPPVVPQTVTPNGPQEKGMSMLTLLMHYNKENAAAYKAQKAAKKAAKAKTPSPSTNAGFTVPGAPNQPKADPGFAVPGQSTPAPQAVQQPAKSNTVPQAVPQPASRPAPQPAIQPSPIPQGQPMNFGDTTVLSGGNAGETTVLSGGKTAHGRPLSPFLIRSKNNEKIPVNKPVYRIGKERSYVDYFVGDNTAVSRSHANIITRDGMYFIMDTNSTNHTYVNGAMIQSNVEVRLSSGDKFRLANEDFEFVLE